MEAGRGREGGQLEVPSRLGPAFMTDRMMQERGREARREGERERERRPEGRVFNVPYRREVTAGGEGRAAVYAALHGLQTASRQQLFRVTTRPREDVSARIVW